MRHRPIALLGLLLCISASPATRPDPRDAIHTLIFGRTDPAGNSFPHMVDPPLWDDTRYLLEAPSHHQFIRALDELLATNGVRVDPALDPRARALIQHALWQVFDWTTQDDHSFIDERIALRKKLAAAIRHVALTREEIDALPANLLSTDNPGSPPNVLDEASGWLSVGIAGSTPVGEAHVRAFRARSAFGVFVHHPEGIPAAKAYLERLAAAPYPPTRESDTGGFYAFESVPHFPVGTRLALVRRMMLIDRNGQIVASPITQSVQIRTFLKIEPKVQPGHVKMEEFVLDRNRYLAGETPAWHAVTLDDREPPTFMVHGIDPFEQSGREPAREYRPPGSPLATCIACHSDPGAASMLSHTRLFSQQVANGPKLEDLSMEREIEITKARKKQEASWGLLRGHWETAK